MTGVRGPGGLADLLRLVVGGRRDDTFERDGRAAVEVHLGSRRGAAGHDVRLGLHHVQRERQAVEARVNGDLRRHGIQI